MRRWRRALASVCAVAVLLAGAACGADDPASEGADDTAGPASPSATPQDSASRKPKKPKEKVSPPVRTAPVPPTLTAAPRAPIPIDGAVLGGDISWPQCPPGLGIPEKRTLGMPMPLDEAEYVIVGLTNGPGFYPNPCLPDQVEWVRSRGKLISAYAVASFPEPDALAAYSGVGPFDAGTELGRLKNVGYQQARFNVTSMLRSGLETPMVWIDVEPVPDFEWSGDLEANAAVVQGLARGYRDAGYDIGVYSTPYLWESVVGDLRLEVPEWRAAGHTSGAEALNRCGPDWVIQGGPAVLGQWVESDRDQNLTCPGVTDLSPYFHRY